MSDTQAYEELTVSSEGVDVVKRFEEDEFPVPAIAFEFVSDRDETVTIRLSDTVPEDIEVEDLGFHPEYGSEYWTIEEDTIVFERDLDANAEYTTVYGIRATGSDDVQQFLTEPHLEDVDPPAPDNDVIPESDDDVIKSAISGDGEIPGLEDEDEEASEEDDENLDTLDLKDPNEPGDSASGDDSDEATSAADQGSVIGAMANEIRQKNVSADDVKILQRALDAVGGERSGSGGDSGATAARLDQLQSDIADLRAYTSALEEFLDENGTGTEIIEDFEDRLDDFEGKLGTIQSDIADNSDEIASLTNEVGSFSDDIESVTSEVEGVSGEMESVRDEVDGVSEDVEELGDDVSAVSGEVDSFGEDIDSLENSVSDLESSIEELEENTTDDDLDERLDELQESIDDLQTWQEQIKETFGG